jgi:hypothetical protein
MPASKRAGCRFSLDTMLGLELLTKPEIIVRGHVSPSENGNGCMIVRTKTRHVWSTHEILPASDSDVSYRLFHDAK